MLKFGELNIGDRFRYNLMFWKKTKPMMQGERRINALFVSDDHYESGRTDIFIESPAAWFGDNKEVEPVDDKLRADERHEEPVTA